MRIGLVLSGGFLKGAYQVGALRALAENPLAADISCISAASIGAINAYAYMTGKLDRIEALWRSVRCDERCSVRQIMKNGYFDRAFASLYSKSDTFGCRFSFPLVDLGARKLIYWDFSNGDDDAMDYLRASIALPFCSAPVHIGDRDFYDGGLVDKIPLGPLCREQLDITICVYFDKYNYIFNDPEQDARIMKVTFADNSVLRTSFYYDTARVEKMIGDGYRRMSEALRWISDGAGETVAIDRRIAEWNEQNINMHQPRINSDVVISNLNRLTSVLARRGKGSRGEIR